MIALVKSHNLPWRELGLLAMLTGMILGIAWFWLTEPTLTCIGTPLDAAPVMEASP